MKVLKIFTALVVASMLAITASAVDYVKSAGKYTPETITHVDSETGKEYTAAIINEDGSVAEYIYSDEADQIYAVFICDNDHLIDEERTLTSTLANNSGITQQIVARILAAEDELLSNSLEDLIEDFAEQWKAATGGAPIEHAGLTNVFDIVVPESIRARIGEGQKLQFSVRINEINYNDKFVTLHKPTEDSNWIVDEHSIDEDHVITFTLDKFSPFAIILDTTAEPTPGEDSPQTGVASYSLGVIASTVVLCGIAFVVIRKASKGRTAA